MVKALGSLLGISFVCALLLGLTSQVTTARIEHNQNARFWKQVNELTAIDVPIKSVEWHNDVWHLCNGLAMVRGETRGYGGPIHLLAAVRLDTANVVVQGLRITRHQETPGIADFINRPEGPWLQHFTLLDAHQIGRVEAVTGATITSRAILRGLGAIATNPALAGASCTHE